MSTTNPAIPAALYSCKRCAEDYSWPARDLQWSKPAAAWVCWQCWDRDADGCMFESTTLQAEIERQNTKGLPRAARPNTLPPRDIILGKLAVHLLLRLSKRLRSKSADAARHVAALFLQANIPNHHRAASRPPVFFVKVWGDEIPCATVDEAFALAREECLLGARLVVVEVRESLASGELTAHPALTEGSAPPIPRALYPCAHCAEDFSWPAEDLAWSEKSRQWICVNCWDHEIHGEQTIWLNAELKKQNTEVCGERSSRAPDHNAGRARSQ